jgi:hypothetical protein
VAKAFGVLGERVEPAAEPADAALVAEPSG